MRKHRSDPLQNPAQRRPLIVVVGGYDGTMEELYLSVVAAALRHGYAVLTYEGPGQGSVIREQGLTFQFDWEKPNDDWHHNGLLVHQIRLCLKHFRWHHGWYRYRLGMLY